MELGVLLSVSLCIIIGNTVSAMGAQENFLEACDLCKRRLAAYSVDCNSLQKQFDNGRSGGNYDSFFGAAALGRKYNNGMFYSGGFSWANKMTPGWFGRKFTNIQGTMYGCTVNGHAAFTQEPKERQFWQKASEKFASQLEGAASVYLNGAKDEPYNKTSIFAMHELPNLKVGRLTAYISTGPGSCKTSSINEMKNKCNSQGIDCQCVDRQEEVQRDLCTDNECVEGDMICSDTKCTSVADMIHMESLPFMIVFITTIHLLMQQK